MLKKLLLFIFMLSGTAVSETKIEFIIGGDLSEEKEICVSFFSGLYENIKHEFKTDNLKNYIEKRFEEDKKLILDESSDVKGLRVVRDGIVVGFISLKPVADNRLQLRRAAFDLKSNIAESVVSLLQFVFTQFPQARGIFTVVRKTSVDEIALLKQFGFEERDKKLLPSEYDSDTYTCFGQCKEKSRIR